MKNVRRFISVLAALLLPLTVSAKPLVSVSMKAEKEIVVVTKGEKGAKLVSADKVDSGEVLFYTLSFKNSGDEAAIKAVFDDPIPQGTVYMPGTAYGINADITFSIDGGSTFKKPSMLTYEVTKPDGRTEKRSASPEEYTHIRWTVSAIPSGAGGQIGFQVRMK